MRFAFYSVHLEYHFSGKKIIDENWDCKKRHYLKYLYLLNKILLTYCWHIHCIWTCWEIPMIRILHWFLFLLRYKINEYFIYCLKLEKIIRITNVKNFKTHKSNHEINILKNLKHDIVFYFRFITIFRIPYHWFFVLTKLLCL